MNLGAVFIVNIDKSPKLCYNNCATQSNNLFASVGN